MDKRIISELRAAIKSEQTEAQNENLFTECAKISKCMFTAYTLAGFTEEQALYLTAAVLTANMKH
ncbi:MAG TPA: hypothetical protein VN258_06470 [Mobilitalea sp.]|nr:hypothetical protein [Mobilitalea sp.]